MASSINFIPNDAEAVKNDSSNNISMAMTEEAQEPATPELTQEGGETSSPEFQVDSSTTSSPMSSGSDSSSATTNENYAHHENHGNETGTIMSQNHNTTTNNNKSPSRRPLHMLPETVHKAQFLAKIKREHMQRCRPGGGKGDTDPTEVLVSIMRMKRIQVSLHSYKDLLSTSQKMQGRTPFFQHPWDDELHHHEDDKKKSKKNTPSRNHRQQPQNPYPLFDHDLLQAVRSGNVDSLRLLCQQRGAQALHCFNQARESLLHVACRRGHTAVVRFLLHEAHVPAQVCDDYGRNPLHDACWTPEPNFDLVLLLLEACPDLLLIKDMRGHTPLRYAPRQHWKTWVKYLARHLPKIVPRFLLR